jgi:hypothetical protein
MRLFPAPQTDARVVERCPVCSSGRIEYEFTVDRRHMARCTDCTMLFFREPLADAKTDATAVMRGRDAVRYLRESIGVVGKILIVLPEGCAPDGFPECDVVAPDALGSFSAGAGPYSSVVCIDVLDRTAEPDSFLLSLRGSLANGATVVFCQPGLDNASAKGTGRAWSGFESGATAFYSVDTLQSLLVRNGYRHVRTFFSGVLNRESICGSRSRLQAGYDPDAYLVAVCRLDAPIQRCRLSVIVPVYNERSTFQTMMKRLVEKQIDGVDIEIIIVESKSPDGSRDEVLTYVDHPRVEIVLQDEARGKGNAVRAGLARATGDIVLFQDADLEYEIEDYDDLIRPIREYQRNFIIGARHGHGTAWKIRDFNGAPVLSQIFNVGHVIFLQLLNVMYGQRLADPFSMFKVFRRDCLAGLSFECDRFDFDFEIVIKLLRKGYRPLEIPVNYHSRSIAEGKKVTMVRDPLTWLRALRRYRTSPLYGKVLSGDTR